MWVKRGICSADSIINIALCCLGVLPGLLHAWYIVLKYPDPYEYEHLSNEEGGHSRGGSRTYIVVPGRGHGQQPNYGTVGSQPSGGQFHGQQTGVVNAFPQPKTNVNAAPQHGVPGQELGGGEGSSQPVGPPPTYADVIKGDHKVQGP